MTEVMSMARTIWEFLKQVEPDQFKSVSSPTAISAPTPTAVAVPAVSDAADDAADQAPEPYDLRKRGGLDQRRKKAAQSFLSLPLTAITFGNYSYHADIDKEVYSVVKFLYAHRADVYMMAVAKAFAGNPKIELASPHIQKLHFLITLYQTMNTTDLRLSPDKFKKLKKKIVRLAESLELQEHQTVKDSLRQYKVKRLNADEDFPTVLDDDTLYLKRNPLKKCWEYRAEVKCVPGLVKGTEGIKAAFEEEIISGAFEASLPELSPENMDAFERAARAQIILHHGSKQSVQGKYKHIFNVRKKYDEFKAAMLATEKKIKQANVLLPISAGMTTSGYGEHFVVTKNTADGQIALNALDIDPTECRVEFDVDYDSKFAGFPDEKQVLSDINRVLDIKFSKKARSLSKLISKQKKPSLEGKKFLFSPDKPMAPLDDALKETKDVLVYANIDPKKPAEQGELRFRFYDENGAKIDEAFTLSGLQTNAARVADFGLAMCDPIKDSAHARFLMQVKQLPKFKEAIDAKRTEIERCAARDKTNLSREDLNTVLGLYQDGQLFASLKAEMAAVRAALRGYATETVSFIDIAQFRADKKAEFDSRIKRCRDIGARLEASGVGQEFIERFGGDETLMRRFESVFAATEAPTNADGDAGESGDSGGAGGDEALALIPTLNAFEVLQVIAGIDWAPAAVAAGVDDADGEGDGGHSDADRDLVARAPTTRQEDKIAAIISAIRAADDNQLKERLFKRLLELDYDLAAIAERQDSLLYTRYAVLNGVQNTVTTEKHKLRSKKKKSDIATAPFTGGIALGEGILAFVMASAAPTIAAVGFAAVLLVIISNPFFVFTAALIANATLVYFDNKDVFRALFVFKNIFKDSDGISFFDFEKKGWPGRVKGIAIGVSIAFCFGAGLSYGFLSFSASFGVAHGLLGAVLPSATAAGLALGFSGLIFLVTFGTLFCLLFVATAGMIKRGDYFNLALFLGICGVSALIFYISTVGALSLAVWAWPITFGAVGIYLIAKVGHFFYGLYQKDGWDGIKQWFKEQWADFMAKSLSEKISFIIGRLSAAVAFVGGLAAATFIAITMIHVLNTSSITGMSILTHAFPVLANVFTAAVEPIVAGFISYATGGVLMSMFYSRGAFVMTDLVMKIPAAILSVVTFAIAGPTYWILRVAQGKEQRSSFKDYFKAVYEGAVDKIATCVASPFYAFDIIANGILRALGLSAAVGNSWGLSGANGGNKAGMTTAESSTHGLLSAAGPGAESVVRSAFTGGSAGANSSPILRLTSGAEAAVVPERVGQILAEQKLVTVTNVTPDLLAAADGGTAAPVALVARDDSASASASVSDACADGSAASADSDAAAPVATATRSLSIRDRLRLFNDNRADDHQGDFDIDATELDILISGTSV
jgi:hypothetical protein